VSVGDDVYDVTGEEQIFHRKNRPTQQALLGKPSSDFNGLVLTPIPVHLTDPSQALPRLLFIAFRKKGNERPSLRPQSDSAKPTATSTLSINLTLSSQSSRYSSSGVSSIAFSGPP